MQPDKHRSRPVGAASADETAIRSGSSIARGTVDRTELVLRCAWLRHHAYELRDLDATGQLTAALFDHADLLEAVYG